VERTGVPPGVPAFRDLKFGAAMRAAVQEADDLTLAGAGNDHRLAPNARGEKVVVVGNLSFVAEENPVLLENVLHLELEELVVRKRGPANSEEPAFVVLRQHSGDCFSGDGHRVPHASCSTDMPEC
jgi:hypothetical protein